ncbi:MAG: hypothetical protein LBU70_04305 [Chitinispirillales bacterium]|jgi:spermidine synthase|nr:hypothetical protein [Chitinispirillales bacterium]
MAPKKHKISPITYIYFALFFISGTSGLIYESIWSQYLKQFLGHAAYAQTLVLVIYMGGMALGAWVAAAGARKFKNLLLGYAIVEIALGISALVFHDIFIRYLDLSFSTIIPAIGRPRPVTLYKWITASLIILPQSMMLGATFPLMAGGILRRFPGLSGYKTSVIYFVNTFGASFGVLFCGFYLVKHWGLKGAIIAGGAIDLAVGISILTLYFCDKYGSRKVSGVDNANNINIKPINNSQLTPRPALHTIGNKRGYYYPLLFVACATAAASFMYEIAWIRMLSLVLGSSTHSFELMLSAFILGLALGSFFVRNKLDSIKNAPRFLAIVQIAMGAGAVMTLFTYGNMFNFMVFILEGLDKTPEGYVFFNIISHFICMIIMLPSTICAGMVVPLIIHMLYKRGYGEQTIGKVYAINTFGGILGVIAAVWLLMELVGLKYVIIIGAAIDMGLGLYVMYRFRETRESRVRTAAQAVVIFVLVSAFAFGKFDPTLASSGVFRYGSVSRTKQILGHIDGKTASVTLFKSGSGRSLVLTTNGKPDASVGLGDEISGDEYTMALLGVLPLSVHEGPRTAAVIGLGAGMTSHFMLYDPAIERLDVIEIEPAMVKLAEMIGPKVANTFNDPRSAIYIEDAKTFFSTGSRTYDVIVSEPSNPWVSGVSSLFSLEFFNHVRNHLNDGGILMQWFHSYEASVTILVSILKALEESFPVYEMYIAGSDLLIIAAKDENADISVKRDIFAFQQMAKSLETLGFSDLDDFRLLRLADQNFLGPFIHGYPTPPNSDFHSYVDLNAAKHRFMGTSVSELSDIRDFIIPVQRIVFADTGFVSLSSRGAVSDLNNLFLAQRARATVEELIVSVFNDNPVPMPGYTPTPVFVLDYASLRPERVNFWQLHDAIIQILQHTLPYLSAEEMRDVWGVVARQTSRMTFGENEARWMDYFRALCEYDLTEMRRLSLELLPATGSITRHSDNRMLMASLLASSAALGDDTDIDMVWSRYTERRNPPAAVRAAWGLLNSKRHY